MSKNAAKDEIAKLLSYTDIKLNGNRPWDIKVNDERFYARVISGGSLAFGESYMDGWWDCKQLDVFFTKIFSAELEKKVFSWSLFFEYVKSKVANLQSKSRAFRIGETHYDIGNDLYKAMLDKRLTYTCGYWKTANTLDKAQEDKLDLVCKKIGLKKGMRVLDIGCGWGSFAKFAAEKYKVKVVGVTVSKEQVSLARNLCKGLPVQIRLQDYRDVNEKFDRIVSLGMFEHVGYKNYRRYMRVVHRCLKDDGLFLLHTIGCNKSVTSTDPWIAKYIFPNSMLPSIKQIAGSIEGLFVMEDWHNFSADYDKTLMAWFNNFNTGWLKLKSKYSNRFYRMWKFYLLACAGSFRSRKNQLWQIVLSKNGVKGGYEHIR
ncbi:cyclopropane-fatty-acyl-phospholipid synthase [Candidatus Woesearchaeota archaeon CG10_big_fil_rev_8_21_14_0_10_37_12]|nr:MAG: cyclopropane-fatty-acyl-phospholipid synthase [Candidatus Woesearchaeota archaeon CG10_big_fil_rev_8_21_14_0_10_37_12]